MDLVIQGGNAVEEHAEEGRAWEQVLGLSGATCVNASAEGAMRTDLFKQKLKNIVDFCPPKWKPIYINNNLDYLSCFDLYIIISIVITGVGLVENTPSIEPQLQK